MALPAQNDITNATTVANLQTEFEDQRDFISTLLGAGTRTELTISAGTVTPGARDHGGIFTVDTEADAGTDDLDTITNTNVADGQLIMLMAETAARVVTLKDANGGTGEMLMIDSADFVLDALDKWILFRRDGTSFEEVARSYGVDNESWQSFREVPMSLSGSKLTPHENLKITRPTVATVTITADRVLLRNANGYAKLYSSVSVTPDISAVAGAGAIDTGTEASSTWYHLWLIGQAGGTVSAVFSTSATSPTLPSGYAFFGYVGAIYNDSGSALDDINQLGARVTIPFQQVVTAGSATSLTDVSIAAVVPSTAIAASGFCRVENTGSAFSILTIANDATPGTAYKQQDLVNTGGTSTAAGANWRVLMPTVSQQIAYGVNAGADRANIFVSGWEF